MLIIREKYLQELSKWKDKHVIKVLTGIRRSGKSTILNQYKNLLIEKNISEKQIKLYDFNNPKLLKLTYEEVYDLILENSIPKKTNYIFLDEIQDIKEFEKCIIGLFENKEYVFDIYLTGSNSHMFSEELATLFTG
ncbi:MAG: AAA family ATPase, partial [Mycoplasmataceae bacterium]|nr:AAA family ATPase [Mycoplasmataceae bacterium]